jgi:hypothetical protein
MFSFCEGLGIRVVWPPVCKGGGASAIREVRFAPGNFCGALGGSAVGVH